MDFFNISIKNKKNIKLVKIFLYISFLICIIGILLLHIYIKYYFSINLFKASIIVFRTGLLCGIFTIICGIFFEKYLNS